MVYWWSPSGHPSYHLDETDNEEKVGGALNDDECLDAHEGIICEINIEISGLSQNDKTFNQEMVLADIEIIIYKIRYLISVE